MRKAVVAETVFLLACEGTSRLFTVSVTLVVARVAGLDVLGELTVGQAVIGIALVAGDAGLGIRAVVAISQGVDVARVVRETWIQQVLLTCAFLAVLIPVGALSVGPLAATFLGIVPLAYAASPIYVLQGRLQMGRMAVARLLGAATTGAGGILGAVLSGSIVWVTLGLAIGALASTAIVVALSGLDAGWVKSSLMQLKRARGRVVRWRDLRDAIPYTIGVHVASSSALFASTLLLPDSGQTKVAVAWKLTQVLALPIVVLEMQFLPRVSLMGTKALVLAAFSFAGVSLSVLLCFELAAREVVLVLYGPEGRASVNEAAVLALTLPLVAINSLLGSIVVSDGQFAHAGLAYGLGAASCAVAGAYFAWAGSSVSWFCVSASVGQAVTAAGLSWLTFGIVSRKRSGSFSTVPGDVVRQS